MIHVLGLRSRLLVDRRNLARISPRGGSAFQCRPASRRPRGYARLVIRAVLFFRRCDLRTIAHLIRASCGAQFLSLGHVAFRIFIFAPLRVPRAITRICGLLGCRRASYACIVPCLRGGKTLLFLELVTRCVVVRNAEPHYTNRALAFSTYARVQLHAARVSVITRYGKRSRSRYPITRDVALSSTGDDATAVLRMPMIDSGTSATSPGRST